MIRLAWRLLALVGLFVAWPLVLVVWLVSLLFGLGGRRRVRGAS